MNREIKEGLLNKKMEAFLLQQDIDIDEVLLIPGFKTIREAINHHFKKFPDIKIEKPANLRQDQSQDVALGMIKMARSMLDTQEGNMGSVNKDEQAILKKLESIFEKNKKLSNHLLNQEMTDFAESEKINDDSLPGSPPYQQAIDEIKKHFSYFPDQE